MERSVTLHGALVGDIWMPAVTATLPVREDLRAIAKRFVNADGSGLVDAVKSVVDGAGDFRSARLTPDSYVKISHTRQTAPGDRVVTVSRYVLVSDLPSLADYVSAEWPDACENGEDD
jgi:hypothetical protein